MLNNPQCIGVSDKSVQANLTETGITKWCAEKSVNGKSSNQTQLCWFYACGLCSDSIRFEQILSNHRPQPLRRETITDAYLLSSRVFPSHTLVHKVCVQWHYLWLIQYKYNYNYTSYFKFTHYFCLKYCISLSNAFSLTF